MKDVHLSFLYNQVMVFEVLVGTSSNQMWDFPLPPLIITRGWVHPNHGPYMEHVALSQKGCTPISTGLKAIFSPSKKMPFSTESRRPLQVSPWFVLMLFSLHFFQQILGHVSYLCEPWCWNMNPNICHQITQFCRFLYTSTMVRIWLGLYNISMSLYMEKSPGFWLTKLMIRVGGFKPSEKY